MNDNDEAKGWSALSAQGKARRDKREARLAAALRTNLRRRKQRGRPQTDAGDGESGGSQA